MASLATTSYGGDFTWKYERKLSELYAMKHNDSNLRAIFISGSKRVQPGNIFFNVCFDGKEMEKLIELNSHYLDGVTRQCSWVGCCVIQWSLYSCYE